MFTPEMQVAVIRGAYTALGSGLVMTLTSRLALVGWENALILGGIAALGSLGFRATEGVVDSRRASKLP